MDEGLPWVSADLELGCYLCSNPTTFHGRFFRSRLDCFQQSWGSVRVCMYSFHQKQLCSHSQFVFLCYFARSNVLFFWYGEGSNWGSLILFYPVFPCSEIHSRCVSVAAIAIAVGGLKQSRLVWPPPIGASLIEYGASSSTERSSTVKWLPPFGKWSVFSGGLKQQQIHRLFFGHYC